MASITIQNGKGKASGSCRFRCCVGRDELGKQVFRTTTVPYPTGLTPAKAKKQLEQQAYAWEEKEREKYKSGIVLTDRDTITLADFIEKHWLPDYVEDGQHKPTGVAYYTGLSKIVVSYFGRKVKLRAIDLEKVKRFIKYMNVDAKTRGGKAYGRSTVQHAFGVLRNIMEYARRLHYIDVDPCLDLTPREKPQRERKKVDYLTSAEARQYLSCLEGEPLLWQCFEYLLLTAGLRRGECLGLQWGDLDRKALTLKISRNVTVDRNSPEKYHVGTTKTGDTRTVPISARMDGMLLRLRREYEQKHGLLLPNAFIFCRDTDPYKPLYPTAPTRWQSRFVERYHLHPVSPHDLRHTAATLALESGADLKQIQELLGHRDPSTTLAFYTGISEEAKRQTVDGIERMLGQTGEEGE